MGPPCSGDTISSFSLRAGPDRRIALDAFHGQPIVLALCGGVDGTTASDDVLDHLRAELRGLGAILLVVSPEGVLCFGAEDVVGPTDCPTHRRTDPGDQRDAQEREWVRAQFGLPPGATGVFVIDGDLRLRFAHVEDAPRGGTLETIAGALAATGHVDVARFTLSRRELLATSLAAALALALDPRPSLAAGPAPAADAASGAIDVTLMINGTPRSVRIDPRVTLLDALRERLGLTGTKKGCDQGQCGACTVLVDGRRVNACLTLAIAAQGVPITTIEGLARANGLHPLQAAFIAHDGFQCGYCTSGQIMSAAGLLAEGQAHSDDEVREQMSGNICRCGAYPNIIAAIQRARKEL